MNVSESDSYNSCDCEIEWGDVQLIVWDVLKTSLIYPVILRLRNKSCYENPIIVKLIKVLPDARSNMLQYKKY